MLKNFNRDYMSWVILISIIILLLEVTFFKSGIIISLFISTALVYFGHKRYAQKKGKFMFWVGLLLLIGNVLSMVTFRFLLIAVMIHVVIVFSRSKQSPKQIIPVIKEQESMLSDPQESLVSTRPLLENMLFGQQKTPSHVYEWNDINIQAGYGDTIVDLSYTVLPQGETVIFIRNIIGKVQVLVPYELEVSITHSVIAGSSTIFNAPQHKLFNQVYQMRTPGFDEAGQRIKIFTSLLAGDLEVKRI